jgi:energy-coupling factor transport system permease protein
MFQSNKSQQSYLSKVGVWTKVGIATILSIAIMIMDDPYALLIVLFMSFLYVLPLRRWKLLIMVYLIILIMFGISMFFSGIVGQFLSESGSDEDSGSIRLPMAPAFIRVCIMINVSLVVALSSTLSNIVSAIKSLHLPVVIYLPLSIVIRFVPSFINEIKLIAESLKIRGVRVTPLLMIRHPGLFLRFIMIPTIVRALHSADDLAIAAEMKGVGKFKKTTNINPEHFSYYSAIVIITAIITLIIAMNYEFKPQIIVYLFEIIDRSTDSF